MSVSQTLSEAHQIMADTNNKATLDNIMLLMSKMEARLRIIENHVKKIDNIEASLNSLTCKVSSMEREVTGMKSKNAELEKSVQSMSDIFDDVKCKAEKNQRDVTSLRSDVGKHFASKVEVSKQQSCAQEDRDELRDAIEDLQCRSMKNNLVFTGLREQRDENTEDKLRDFIRNELHIEQRIEFGNVHRFQKHVFGRNRPIVARFLYNQDRQDVKNRGYMLRGTRFGINEQFPAPIEERRKKLYPVMKHHRSMGHSVRLVRDRLYIDGILYGSESEAMEEDPDTEPKRTYSDMVQSGPLIDFSTPNNGRGSKRGRAPSTPSEQNSRRPTPTRPPQAAKPRVSPTVNPDFSRSPHSATGHRSDSAADLGSSFTQAPEPGHRSHPPQPRPSGDAGACA